MISSIVYLSEPSETSTSQMAPVGTVRAYMHPTYGYQVYRMVKATTAIDANKVAAFDAGSSVTAAHCASGDLAARVAGIAQNAIAAGSYGWVVCSGQCKGLSSAAVTQDAHIQCSGTGIFDDSTIAIGQVLGVAVDTFGSATTGTVRLSGLL